MASEVSAADSKYSSSGLLANAAVGSGVMDKNAFLMLLVTQFQYQDPLNPMEDKEFVAQLAQFSALEQSMSMNENLEKMLAMQQEQQILYAVNYIGKEVLARGYGISVSDGGRSVTSVEYALDAAAVKGFINILDSSNSIVTTMELPALGYGIHTFNWDGKDSSGVRVPDGVYTVAISATDADGQLILPDTQVSGIVKGISTYQGEQYLTLTDNRVVAIKNVREILSSDAAAKTSDGAGGG